MIWFLEITCTAAAFSCLITPINQEVPRYYKTERDCINAIIVLDRLWDPGPHTAFKFNCLPITPDGRG